MEYLYDLIADGMLFYVLVTVEYAERSTSTRGTAKGRKHLESKNTVDQVTILGSSCAQFIAAALTAHNLRNVYVPGPTSGPGFKIHWSGSRYTTIICYMALQIDYFFSGGKGQAPLISDDADWRTIVVQLQVSVNRP